MIIMADVSLKTVRGPAPIIKKVIMGCVVVLVLSGVAVAVNRQRFSSTLLLLALAYTVGALGRRTARGALDGDESAASVVNRRPSTPDETITPAHDNNLNQESKAAFVKDKLDNATREKMRSLVKRNHELLVLYSLANVVGSSLQLSEVINVGLDGVMRLFGARAGEISVVGAAHENLVMFARGSTELAAFQGAKAPRLNRRLAAQVAKTGEPIVTEVGIGEDALSDAAAAKGITQLAVFPIKAKTRILGTITLACAGSCVLDNKDRELLVSIGSLMGGAMENSRLYERIKHLSDTDAITGLYNHRFIIKRLNSELKRAGRYGHMVSVIMLDVDGFKELNDTFGHPFGDSALRKIALAIAAGGRDTDYIGRYGGDEFLIVLPETGPRAATVVGDRVRRHIESLSLIAGGAGGETVKVTASLGLAVFPRAGKNSTEIITAADKNLYISKRSGKNRMGGLQAA